MTTADALAEDRAGNIVRAADLYEAGLLEEGHSLEAVLNLAVLYWESTEFGFSCAHQLSPEFVVRAADRCQELLTDAEREYPASTQPRFWNRYTSWLTFGGSELSEDECRAMLRRSPSELVPILRLNHDDSSEYEAEATVLLRQCELDNTTRSRYVAAVIRGVNTRRIGRLRRRT